MPNAVITSVFSSKIPHFIYGVDKEENEYILYTPSPQYLIKFNGVIDPEELEDDEDIDEDAELLLEKEGYEKVEFHVEIFKFTKSGLTPITYEYKVKAVQDIVNEAIAFYLDLE
jgi:hypothetical protein